MSATSFFASFFLALIGVGAIGFAGDCLERRSRRIVMVIGAISILPFMVRIWIVALLWRRDDDRRTTTLA